MDFDPRKCEVYIDFSGEGDESKNAIKLSNYSPEEDASGRIVINANAIRKLEKAAAQLKKCQTPLSRKHPRSAP
jgi:hypothetical protein